jgi:putative peptidoglycan lipid II flippase
LAFGTTLVQQVLYARALGVGTTADVLAIGLTYAVGISGLIGTTFAGVVLPAYLRKDPSDGALFFRSAHFVALLAAAIGAAATIAFSSQIADAAFPAATDVVRDDLRLILWPMGLLIVAWTSVATVTALANAKQRYVFASFAAAIPSVPVIVVLVAGQPTTFGVVAAYIMGAIAQLTWLGLGLRRYWRELMPRASLAVLPAVGRASAATATGLFLISMSAVIARSIASVGGPGEAAGFDYAMRLATALEQILLTGLLSVVFTTWSMHGAGHDGPLSLENTLLFVGGAAVIVAGGLATFSAPIIDVVLRGGQFSESNAIAVGTIVAWIAPGIAAHMVVMVAARAIQARGSSRFFVELGILVTAVIGVAGAALQAAGGAAGVGAAFSLAWISASALVLWRANTSSTILTRLAREMGLAVLATVLAGAIALAVQANLNHAASPVIPMIVFTGVAIACGWAIGVACVRTSIEFVALRLPFAPNSRSA